MHRRLKIILRISLAMAIAVGVVYVGLLVCVHRRQVRNWLGWQPPLPAIVTRHQYINVDVAPEPNKVQQDFFECWQSRRGTYGMRKTEFTIEGDPVVLYLLTADGDATLVLDARQDQWRDEDFWVSQIQTIEWVSIPDRNTSYLKLLNADGEEMDFDATRRGWGLAP